ncbi:hypothetical protein [Escherichia coli]|uniref:hypothetical protein n=1 Tax=Escherichia coli TaxID=562 RepID=UPI003EBBD219
MFDGALIEYAATSLFEMRRKPGKEAILMAWNVEEHDCGWKHGVYHCQDGTFLFLLIPLNRRARNCSTQTLIVWTGMAPTRRQNELYNTGVSKVIKSSFMPPNFTFIRP